MTSKFNHLLFFFFISILISSCGKKTEMKGRIVNPVTNEGISGINVYVTRPKAGIGYDGSGTKTLFKTVSDENGYFTIEERFRKSKSYTISYGYDQKKYQLYDAQVSPAGAEYDGSYFEFSLVPLGRLLINIQNQNCFDENDDFAFTWYPSLDTELISSGNFTGCYSYFGNYNDVKMGWHKIEGFVTKNGITTPFADSIYVTEGGNHVWDIEY